MADLRRTWLATFTRRWHANPALCHTVDPVGAHSARMALILLHLWPDASRALIVAAVKHDLAESVVGDMPGPAKRMLPVLGTMERAVAVENGWHVQLDDTDEARLKFADRLDAYMWAEHHRATDADDWADAAEWLRYAAERMGVRDKLEGIL